MNLELENAGLPALLQEGVRDWLSEHAADGLLADLLVRVPSLRPGLLRSLACSSYLADVLARYPHMLGELCDDGRLDRPLASGELTQLFETGVPVTLSEPDCLRQLRELRHRELLRIAWRDLNGMAPVAETLVELSALADAALRAALAWSESALASVYGQPRDTDGGIAAFVILAMGKLGGRELNFSSDVDVVFLYTDQGETDGSRQVSNEQYFRSLAQKLIGLLAQKTADGFVYRMDARLRPFGDSGPLAVSLPALETYLLRHGRDWERYAYVKARVVNDWPGSAELEQDILRPFVYRRYLDYGVFSSLRDMKSMIEAEGRRKEYSQNLKLGPGGIREIEFIVQSLQLVRGGTTGDLRERELQPALVKLVRHECLPPQVADELQQAYEILRRTENRLQEIADRQTHDLPAAEPDRSRLAFATGHADWDSLMAELNAQRQVVARHFRNIVFRGAEDAPADETLAALTRVWVTGIDAGRDADTLEAAGYADGAAACERLQAFCAASVYQRMDEVGRQRLDALMPALLRVAGQQADAAAALDGALQVIEAIGRRSAYFALLNENPAALERLVRLCGLSTFLVRQLAAHPLLLDELLDPRIFTEPPGRAELLADLNDRLQAVDHDDSERRQYALINFQQAATFRVAVADLSGALPLMKVSDRLTDIAELILQAALDFAWDELVARHGQPRCEDDGARVARFAIVAYGKLGGLELGYGSDLDLVFVHDATGEHGETDGDRPLENSVFFARLARRIIHVLSVATAAGSMYEVDTRLRPSGRSGLLVSSLAALDRYQREDAWTWEHQALLRSRAVAGDADVCAAYEQLRLSSLARYVRRDSLQEDVAEMRERMRSELSKGDAGVFDLKQDPGGIADIEFLVQYLVLRDAHRYPDLTTYSDNIRQLDALAANQLLPAEEAQQLADAYRDYRAQGHRLSLAGAPALVPHADVARWAPVVTAIWQRVFGHAPACYTAGAGKFPAE